CHGTRGWRKGPADDEIVGAGADRRFRGHDTRLVVLRGIGRTDAGRHQLESGTACFARRRCSLCCACDAVEAATLREPGKAQRVRLWGRGDAELTHVGVVEAREY